MNEEEVIYSMTGFAHNTAEIGNVMISCEVRSLNHRYRDIYIHLIEGLYHIEENIYNEIASVFERGKYNIYLNLGGNDSLKRLDIERLRDHRNRLMGIKKELGISGEIDMELLLSTMDEDVESVVMRLEWDDISTLIEETIDKLKRAQKREGMALKEVCVENLRDLQQLWNDLEKRDKETAGRIREKLTKVIENNLNEDYDEGRLAQEIVHYAERANISEEIDRLSNHMEYFRETINSGSPCGKKLNFITQEMFREADTISAKSDDTEITNLVVEMKTRIENLREQVQNIM